MRPQDIVASQIHIRISETASVQNITDAVIDKEIRVIVKSLRPADESSYLITQPEISEAVARLKGEMSQLIEVAKSLQSRDTTVSQPRHLNHSDSDERHGGKDSKPQEYQSPETSSTDKFQDEPYETYLAITKGISWNARPLLTAQKFTATGLSADATEIDWDRRAAAIIQGTEEKRNSKEWYFFYGSLMDPRQLQQVLGLKERPRDLRPASIRGYLTRMWGPYPVLLHGPPGNVVKGVAYEIERDEHKAKLARYETANYREHNCIIQFNGEKVVVGTTFEWDGDECELRDGSFDLKDWQMEHLLDE